MTSQNVPVQVANGVNLPTLEPAIHFSSLEQLAALCHGEVWEKTGVARISLARYPDLRISLNALKVGKRIEKHQNPGRISVQTVAGHIRMHAAGRDFDLPLGAVLALDRAVPHDVEAIGEDSAFLLTVAVPQDTPKH